MSGKEATEVIRRVDRKLSQANKRFTRFERLLPGSTDIVVAVHNVGFDPKEAIHGGSTYRKKHGTAYT